MTIGGPFDCRPPLADGAALAQPYPERIAELQREVEALNDEIEAQVARAMFAEEKLASTRQQYADADHGSRMWHAQCKGLRSANGRLSNEIATLRSEASELMAAEANHIQAIDAYKVREAHLEQQLAWHVENATKQAEVIRAQGAEIERLKRADVPPADHASWLSPSGLPHIRAGTTGQYDLPPTRGEEQEQT